MKKNFFNIAFAFSASAVLLSGCMFEQEDFFDESAALRIQHTNEEIKDILCEQSTNGNGWVMQYFVAGTDDYDFEGFNLFAKFEQSGKVTMASDHRYLRNGNANKYTEASSIYQMLAEEGPVLSFNSWNDVITVFSDPVDPEAAPKNIVSNGEGMRGDYNLVVTSFSKDKITLRGERYGARSCLIPCPLPFEEYIDSIKVIKSLISNDGVNALVVTDGTNRLCVTNLQSGLVTLSDRVLDPLSSSLEACVFDLNGFHFEHKNTIVEGGEEYQDFVFDYEKGCFSEINNPNVVIKPEYENAGFFVRAMDMGKYWNFASYSEGFADLYSQVNAGATKKKYKFNGIKMTKESDGRMRVDMVFTTGGKSTAAGFYFDVTDSDENSITMSYVEPSTTNAANVLTAIPEIQIMLTALSDKFNVTRAGNNFLSKNIVATSVTDPSKWFEANYTNK